jgi:hypothetical protein
MLLSKTLLVWPCPMTQSLVDEDLRIGRNTLILVESLSLEDHLNAEAYDSNQR